jgi:TM2 domain-containing membrane protein YozV
MADQEESSPDQEGSSPDVEVRDTESGLKTKVCNKWVSFLLCFLVGQFGTHKFYEGKPWIGTAYISFFIVNIINIVNIISSTAAVIFLVNNGVTPQAPDDRLTIFLLCPFIFLVSWIVDIISILRKPETYTPALGKWDKAVGICVVLYWNIVCLIYLPLLVVFNVLVVEGALTAYIQLRRKGRLGKE